MPELKKTVQPEKVWGTIAGAQAEGYTTFWFTANTDGTVTIYANDNPTPVR